MKNIRRKGNNQTLKSMRCPYCGGPVRLRSAEGIYKNGGSDVLLYVCSNYPKCDSYVRVHEGTIIPVGNLANAKLRTLRRTAHQHFDKLHETGLMKKEDAYSWLAYTLHLPPSQTHIGYFSEYYCTLVITECDKYFDMWKHKLRKNRRPAPAYGGGYRAAQ